MTIAQVIRGVLLAFAGLVAVFLVWVAIGLTARTGSDAERHEVPAKTP